MIPKDLDHCYGCGSAAVTWINREVGYAACESCADAFGIIRRNDKQTKKVTKTTTEK